MGSFLKLKKLLEEKGSFVLVCHVEPDGDAIGSMLALEEALEQHGKKVRLVSKDPVPAMFDFLEGSEKIENDLGADFDAIILLDNGDFRRTGFQTEIEELKRQHIPLANIDHHPKNDLWRVVDINYADEHASSASELLYRVFIGLGYEITPKMATALLCGIFYDTGGFRHSNTTEAVLVVASDLLKRGAKLKKISEHIESSKSLPLFKLWGIALNRLRLDDKSGISISYLLQADLQKIGATEEDVPGLVNLLNSAPESRAALLLYETSDVKIKGSLRTDRDDVDLSELARYLGGGGHKKAAGFTIDGRLVIEGDKIKIV